MSPFTKTPKIGALRASGLTPSSIILHSMKVNHCFFHVFPWYPFILHGFSSHIPWIFHGTPWIIFGKLTPGCNSGHSCWSSTGTARWGWKWSSPPCMLKWYTICVQPYAKNSMYYIYMCVYIWIDVKLLSFFFLPSSPLLIIIMQGDRALWCYSVQRSYASEREASIGHGCVPANTSNGLGWFCTLQDSVPDGSL